MAKHDGYAFELDDELSEGDLVALRAVAADGHAILLYAQVELTEQTVILRQLAIYGVGTGPGDVGPARLRQLVRALMEEFDVDHIRIEEARRLTGANPNRTVRGISFRR